MVLMPEMWPLVMAVVTAGAKGFLVANTGLNIVCPFCTLRETIFIHRMDHFDNIDFNPKIK